jgi:hypothetical protein
MNLQIKEIRVNPSTDLAVTINDVEVEQVKSFTYLGSIATVEDVHNHIKKANRAFVQLFPLWRNTNILVGTKIWLFNTNAKSGLL